MRPVTNASLKKFYDDGRGMMEAHLIRRGFAVTGLVPAPC